MGNRRDEGPTTDRLSAYLFDNLISPFTVVSGAKGCSSISLFRVTFVFVETISLSPTYNTRQLVRLSDYRAEWSAYALTGVDFFTAPGPRSAIDQRRARIAAGRRAGAEHHMLSVTGLFPISRTPAIINHYPGQH